MSQRPIDTESFALDTVSPNGNVSADSGSAPGPAPRRRGRNRVVLALGVVLGLALLTFGIRYVRYARAHESTDDAFIDGHIVGVSPKVASNVAHVYVDDNTHVKAGDLLVELDPRDFEARLAQARANLAAAVQQHRAASWNVRVVERTAGAGVEQAEAAVLTGERQVDGARSRLEQARAQVVAAEAEATRAAADVQRYESLLKYGAVSRQERDNAVATNDKAAADLDAAQRARQAAEDSLRQQQAQLAQERARLASAQAAPDQMAQSRAQADQLGAQIAQYEAAVRQAELDLSYTRLYAPESGRVTRKSVEPGAYVQVGQTLFSIVPDRVWVVANFKETQLRHMRPGQPATVRVDAYPDRIFHGHVDSIQAGSGARFSLLPPENATGNYVKVVQRVPVKIVIDESADPQRVLGPGMSVVPDVRVR
jgi:membrane fusion protein, multidrug efflux system